jgi:hypothetical protein
MVGALAMLLAAQAAATRTEIPVASFSAPDSFSICREAGIPSIGIHCEGAHREMEFGRFDDPPTSFELHDAVKSVIYERNARGRVAEGTPVRIDLVVHREGGADFTLVAGNFSQSSTGCGPTLPRPGHMQ